uniref:Uncharacterized protein n=1 Tax=Strongyloides venezuelensis TaxID=75913 RepID=A0A0K0EUK7_STRVS
MLILEPLVKSIILLLMTYLIPSVYKCSNNNKPVSDSYQPNKKLQKKRRGDDYKKSIEEVGKEFAKKRSKSRSVKTVDMERKKLNKNIDKVLKNKLILNKNQNFASSKNMRKSHKPPSYDKDKHYTYSDKLKNVTKVESKRNQVVQVNDFDPQTRQLTNKDASIDPVTMSIDKCGLKSCKSLLGIQSNDLKLSSVREGEGNYQSLMLDPVLPDSPVQAPKFPEIDSSAEEPTNKKDNNSFKSIVINNDQDKNDEAIKVANTQSISTASGDLKRSNSDKIDLLLKGNIFDNSKKSLSICPTAEELDIEVESTQRIDN